MHFFNSLLTFVRVKGLEKEKKDLTERHDQVLRDLRRKTDATIDSMKKEHSSTASKVRHAIYHKILTTIYILKQIILLLVILLSGLLN